MKFKQLNVEDSSISTDLTEFFNSMTDKEYTNVELVGRKLTIMPTELFNEIVDTAIVAFKAAKEKRG